MTPEEKTLVGDWDKSKVSKVAKFILSSPTAVRSLLGISLQTSAAAGHVSSSIASSNNSTATSKAVAELSDHIEIVLDGENPQIAELSISIYLGKVDALNESRIPAPKEGFARFRAPLETWNLILTAVKHSAASYEKSVPNDYQGIFIKPKAFFHHIKATRIEVVEVSTEVVIVVSIRGSASLDDWLLNFNGDPISANIEDTLDQTGRWHRGFFESFRSSEADIANGIRQIVVNHPHVRRLLFTGHSAGGAIAQLCYDSCGLEESRIGTAISGLSQIDCITFGTPPITKTPIVPRSGPSIFLSIINEGDPVVLAQKEYIKSLFTVYILSKAEWEAKYPLGFDVPLAELHASGTCVILGDTNEDGEEEVLEAIHVPFELVERALFGNFCYHLMRVYSHRVETLVTAMILESNK